MRRWEALFTETDRKVARKAGFGGKQKFGKNPALLIIDVTNSFIGSSPKPVVESIEEYGTSCGEAGWKALDNIKELLNLCQANSIPVIYTTYDTLTSRLLGISAVKRALNSSELSDGANKIADPIAPLPSDLVIYKVRASAFFGTPLDICLRKMEIDCLLIAGTSTSGCVRATVVDALSYGYKCFLVEECTFDRFELSHLVNLFDMNAKYADVITLKEAQKYITYWASKKKS